MTSSLRAFAREASTTQAPPSEQRPQDMAKAMAHLYHTFTLSVSSSILHSLVNSGGDWVQFGNDACLRAYKDPTAWATPGATVEWLRVDVQWSPSGVLTVSGRLRHLPSFSPLADALQNGKGEHRGSPGNRARVFMLPFGTPCELLGEESRILGTIEDDRPFKTSTRAWLENHGIPTQVKSSWVCLEFRKKGSYHNPLLNSAAVHHMWWPTHLCFIKQVEMIEGNNEELETIVTGTFTDPLEEAEQWFLGRKERESIIEARSKEVEAMKLRSDQAPDHEDSETDEDPAGDMIHANQYLSAQEASGIYPTPPDGFTSTTQGFLSVQDAPGASLAGGNPYVAEAISQIDSPNIAMSGAPLAGDDDQDLFGDMDADMFDTNGLTEADFNFFDEPDEVNEMQADLTEIDAQDTEERIAEAENRETEGVQPDVSTREDTPLEPESEMQASEGQSLAHHNPSTELEPSDDLSTMLDPSEEANGPETLQGILATDTIMLDGNQIALETTVLDSCPEGFNRKYGQAGKYAASSPEAQHGTRPSGHREDHRQKIPSLGLLRKRSQDSSQDSESSEPEALESIKPGDTEDWSAGTKAANGDINIPTEENMTRKRKRGPSIGSNDLETPSSVSSFQVDLDSSTNLDRCIAQGIFHYDASNTIVDLIENDVMTNCDLYIDNGKEFIELAQLVVDQAVQQTESPRMVASLTEERDSRHSNPQHNTSELTLDILSRTLPGIQQYDLQGFLELDAQTANNASQKPVVQVGHEERLQIPALGINNKDEVIFEARVPYLSVRRGPDTLDIAPSALYFWEELGLGPSQENRDIEALCIYPDVPAIRDAVYIFMSALENSYQSCKLGFHKPLEDFWKVQDGLLEISITSVNLDSIANSFDEACEDLGTELPLKEANGTSIVVYLVNPFNDDKACPYLCAAFQSLKNAYILSAVKAGLSHPRAMVLQIVPLGFLASGDSLIIPPPKAYTRLAFEVYSRCKPGARGDGTMPAPFESRSAIRFAKPIPKSVNFQLNSQPPGSLLSSDSCLHLAYSWNIHDQWLSCAWTDNLGTTQWTAIYCLSDPVPDYWKAFADTVKEVLDTTKDLLRSTDIPWRLYISKDDHFRGQELDSKQDNRVEFSRQTNNNISFSGSPLDTSFAASTPNEQILTPDYASPNVTSTPGRGAQTTPAATGFLENDPAARLVDVVSRTWVVISPTPALDPYRRKEPLAPILVSGYLLKRAGAEDSDGIVSLGINLVATVNPKGEGGNHQAHTKTLTGLLGMYSDLAMLARLRGLEEWSLGILPWHMAAARKARKTVTRCMRWGEEE
ncbi:MAG: hypothetical protein Q9168_006960 [Polycauliona sp. 1 TL-2023]